MDLVKVRPFDNVAASSKATTFWEPEGPSSLFGFIFRPTGTFNFATDVDTVTLKHSGKTLVPGISGTKLIDIANYEGLDFGSADNEEFALLFGDPTARTARGQHIGNFDHVTWPGKMTIELDLGAGAAAGLDVWAIVSPPKAAMGLGYTAPEVALHRAFVETVIQPAAAITQKAFDIGLGSEAGALLKRLIFFHSKITQVQVKRSGFDIYEDIPNSLAAFFQEHVNGRNAADVASMLVYDPIVDGNYSEVKATVDQAGRPYNYQVRLTTSAADTITAYADVLTTLRRL